MAAKQESQEAKQTQGESRHRFDYSRPNRPTARSGSGFGERQGLSTDNRGLRRSSRASVSDPQPRRRLRNRGSATAAGASDQRGADSAPEPLAKRLRRTLDRIHPTGVPEPFCDSESAPPEKDADRLPVLLPPDEDTFGAGQTMSGGAPGNGDGRDRGTPGPGG